MRLIRRLRRRNDVGPRRSGFLTVCSRRPHQAPGMSSVDNRPPHRERLVHGDPTPALQTREDPGAHARPNRDASRSITAWPLHRRPYGTTLAAYPSRRRVRAVTSVRGRTRTGRIEFQRTSPFATWYENPSTHANARHQARLEAGAERTLEAVACPGRIGDYPTGPPTDPYVKISLIRFLGTARCHTARWPDIADNPRHLSPSALQHDLSRLLCVPGVSPALSPPFHDLGPRQRVRCHHPTTCSPRHLPTSTAVQPVPPRARCRIVHQVEAWAVTPDAIILGVPPQLRTQ